MGNGATFRVSYPRPSSTLPTPCRFQSGDRKGGHRLDRLPLPVYQQALHIMRGGAATFAATQTRDQGSHKLDELRNAVLPEAGIPFYAPNLCPRR